MTEKVGTFTDGRSHGEGTFDFDLLDGRFLGMSH